MNLQLDFSTNQVIIISAAFLALIIAIIILIVFMITVMFQSIITIPGHSNFATALRVHIKHGFYIESFVNRLSRKSNNPAHTGLKTKNLN